MLKKISKNTVTYSTSNEELVNLLCKVLLQNANESDIVSKIGGKLYSNICETIDAIVNEVYFNIERPENVQFQIYGQRDQGTRCENDLRGRQYPVVFIDKSLIKIYESNSNSFAYTLKGKKSYKDVDKDMHSCSLIVTKKGASILATIHFSVGYSMGSSGMNEKKTLIMKAYVKNY